MSRGTQGGREPHQHAGVGPDRETGMWLRCSCCAIVCQASAGPALMAAQHYSALTPPPPAGPPRSLQRKHGVCSAAEAGSIHGSRAPAAACAGCAGNVGPHAHAGMVAALLVCACCWWGAWATLKARACQRCASSAGGKSRCRRMAAAGRFLCPLLCMPAISSSFLLAPHLAPCSMR